MTQPNLQLTQAQIDFYNKNGYLQLEALTTPDEVQTTREIYDDLFARQAGREEGDQYDLAGTDEEGKKASLPQIMNPTEYAPELINKDFRKNALAIARQLLGDSAEPNGEHAIFKPASAGAATPWHQDEAYWDPSQQYDAISIWMPLQVASMENGCLHFVPGSHEQEVHPHHSIGHDPCVHGLEIDDVDDSQAVACPLPAGGCTIHHSRTLHYAGPNLTEIPRRAYILMFTLPPTKRQEVREFPWLTLRQTARETRCTGC